MMGPVFTAALVRLDAALRDAPHRNPDHGSDAILIIADAIDGAAEAMDLSTITAEEELRAFATALRNRATRARTLASIHATPMTEVSAMEACRMLRRKES